MKILSIASDGSQAVLITEVPYLVGSWDHKAVWLSTLRCATADLEPVVAHLHAKGDRTPVGFEVLDRWPLGSRNRGPKSRYRKRLAAIRDELSDHLAGDITLIAHDDENAMERFIQQPTTDGWQEVEQGVHVTSLDHLVEESRFNEKALVNLILGGGVVVERRGATP